MRARILLSAVALAGLLTTPALTTFAAAAPAAAQAEQVNPREAVQGVARAIEDNYWDPAKGKAVADGLRAAAAKGEFDALTDPRDLAQALTRRLQPLDHHFNVAWPMDPPAGMGPGGPGPGPRPGPRPGPGPGAREENPFERRGNYGFRQVSVLPGNIGYIEMSGFANFDPSEPGAPARAAADAALALVANTDAIIIDLRDNGGGSPAMVGYLASAFVAKDADVYNVFHSRQGTRSEAPQVPYARPRLDVPVYILTSARTGSAAEAFPYTLLAAKRAVTVGEQTGGAANPGGMVPAGGRFAVFVSGGSPINPVTKGNWEGAGVTPTVAVPAAEALDKARLLILADLLKGGQPPEVMRDTQWALDGLRAELAPPLAVTAADYVGDYGGATVSIDAAGALSYQRGKRPPWRLVALGGDVFTVRGQPSRRLTFERDGAGKVTALGIEVTDGPGQRLRKAP